LKSRGPPFPGPGGAVQWRFGRGYSAAFVAAAARPARKFFNHRLRSIDMPIVKFINEKKEIEVAHGANLRKEAIKAGINVHQGLNGIGATLNKFLNCHGFGQCGTCRVRIVKGMENTSPMGIVEKLRFKCPLPTPVTPGTLLDPIIPPLSFIGNESTMRLACQTKVLGDIEVETGPKLDLFGENFFS
jgi:ferredoxin